MSELICQRDGRDRRVASKQESVSKGRLRLNLLYDRSSKGSWRWHVVCDSERTSKSSSLPREFGPQSLLSYIRRSPPPRNLVDERVPEHVDSSSSACRDIPNVLTIIRGDPTQPRPSFLLSLSSRSSVATPPIISNSDPAASTN